MVGGLVITALLIFNNEDPKKRKRLRSKHYRYLNRACKLIVLAVSAPR